MEHLNLPSHGRDREASAGLAPLREFKWPESQGKNSDPLP